MTLTRQELQHRSVNELIDLILALQENNEQLASADTPASASFNPYANDSQTNHQIPDELIPSLPQTDNGVTDEPAPSSASADDQLRRTSLLMQIAMELRETFDPVVIVERVLRVIAHALQVNNTSIMLIGPGNTVELAQSLRDKHIFPMPRGFTRVLLDRGLAGWVLRHGRSVVLSDVLTDKRWISYVQWQQTGSAMVLPIRQAQTVMGVLTLYHTKPNYFTSQDLLLMEGVVSQVAMALGSSKRFADISRRREQALALFSMTQFLTAEYSYRDLVQQIHQKSVSVFGVHYGLLYLLNDQGQLQPVGLSPAETDELAPIHHPALMERIGLAAQNAYHQQQIVNDTHADQALNFTCIALPLIQSGKAIGSFVLVYETHIDSPFSSDMWQMLAIFTNVIAVTCANMQLIQRLKQHSEKLEALIEHRTEQLQRSRDLLRIVFDNLAEGLVLVDAGGAILATNYAFCRAMTGGHPRNIVGKRYNQIWDEHIQSRIETCNGSFQELDSPSESGQEYYHMRICTLDTKGQKQWYDVDRLQIAGMNDQATQYLERWSNVTWQESLSALLEQTERWMGLGSLLSTTIVRLRETTMQMHQRLQQASQDQDDIAAQWSEMLPQTIHDAACITQLLEDLSVWMDQTNTSWQPTAINDIINQAHQLTYQLFQRERVQLELLLDQHLPDMYLQPDGVLHVVLSLLLSVRKSLLQGGTLVISSQWITEGKHQTAHAPCCQISFLDMSHSIDLTQFKQLLSPDTSESSLVLTRTIIAQHKGLILVTEEHEHARAIQIMIPDLAKSGIETEIPITH
ncbi:MAG: GAF domain-containing protein [Chloroflexaceae bacterium]|nr:GAF domain-containing protein [Chloroflexaceae bacterium]